MPAIVWCDHYVVYIISYRTWVAITQLSFLLPDFVMLNCTLLLLILFLKDILNSFFKISSEDDFCTCSSFFFYFSCFATFCCCQMHFPSYWFHLLLVQHWERICECKSRRRRLLYRHTLAELSDLVLASDSDRFEERSPSNDLRRQISCSNELNVLTKKVLLRSFSIP